VIRRCVLKNQILTAENHSVLDTIVIIPDLVTRHAIGPVGIGNMLLQEMFSPIGGPREDELSEIDWIGDLKAFIDDNESLLSKRILPAIDKHKQHLKNPNAYKIYIKAIKLCADDYCNAFDIAEKSEIFPTEKIIELAKIYAEQQENFIGRGDYEG